jgi:hypothetical protein
MWWLWACAPPEAPPPDDGVEIEAPRQTLGAPARAIWGGNLLALSDGRFAAVDPTTDQLYFGGVGGDQLSVAPAVRWPAGSAPWRLAEHDGLVFVALRGAGRVARVGLDGVLRGETAVCPDVRGIAAGPDGVGVACADGAFAVIDAAGAVTERATVAPDAREVAWADGGWWVATFRHAALHRVGSGDGPIALPTGTGALPRRPEVAWRMQPDPVHGGVLIAHQRARADRVDLTVLGTPAYGSDACDAAVEPAVTRVFPDGTAETTASYRKGVLPVDLVADADGILWLASAGADGTSDVGLGWLSDAAFSDSDACLTAPGYPWSGITGGLGGRVTAAARVGSSMVIAIAAPFGLALAPGSGVTTRWWADPDALPDRGVHLFHAAPVGTLACASCHPEGNEDGHVWRFGLESGEVVRRTQSLAAGASAHTAPLHWAGEFPDLPTLLADTFETRMGGTLAPGDADALGDLLASFPRDRVAGPADPAGAQAFADAGCDDCHAGPWGTDGRSYDVGTGEVLQTPSLVGVGSRDPWLHDGCAATLADRFDPACGGDQHGDTVPPDALPALLSWLSAQ